MLGYITGLSTSYLEDSPQLIAQGLASLSVTGSASGVYSLNAVPYTLSVMGC